MIIASADRGTITASWQHQREALAFVKDKPGSMLAMEMGTGKTKVAIDLMDFHGYRRVLIVVGCQRFWTVLGPRDWGEEAPGLRVSLTS